MIDYNCPQYDYIPLLQMLRKSLSTSLLAPPFFMIPRERPNVKAIDSYPHVIPTKFAWEIAKKESKTLWGLAWRMAGVKSPGPSMERRRDTLQADLGCLCCVFPGACEVAFLLENQGGLEKLVHHESLRQKTCYPNQETRAKQCHNDHVCDCTCKTSESRILYQQAGIWID